MIFNKLTQLSLICSALTIFGVKAMDSLSQDELNTQLIDQIDDGNLVEVKKLVDSKADVNSTNEFGWTPLMTASLMGKDDIVDYLLKEKGDVNAQSARKDTALIAAAKKNKLNIVDLLLSASKDSIDELDGSNRSALMHASSFGSPELVEKLIKSGSNVNIQDKDGNTPLMSAVSAGRFPIVKKLVELGADIAIENNEGEMAIDLANSNDYSEIADYLEKTLKEQIKRKAAISRALSENTNLPDVISDIIIGYDI